MVESIGDPPLIAPASAEVEPGPDADEPDGEEAQVRKARKSPEMPSASEFEIRKSPTSLIALGAMNASNASAANGVTPPIGNSKVVECPLSRWTTCS